MWKKVVLNVFYNLAIIVSIFGIAWAYNNAKYMYIASFVVIAGFFTYQKIQLIRAMRKNLKK